MAATTNAKVALICNQGLHNHRHILGARGLHHAPRVKGCADRPVAGHAFDIEFGIGCVDFGSTQGRPTKPGTLTVTPVSTLGVPCYGRVEVGREMGWDEVIVSQLKHTHTAA